jgi:hypothetical protein
LIRVPDAGLRQAPRSADAYAAFGYHYKLVQLGSVIVENVFDPLEHFGGRAGAKPKEDACVGLPMRNHQLAEVAIIGNHDATFAPGDLKDLNVFDRGRVVLAYGCYVMTELSEAGGD